MSTEANATAEPDLPSPEATEALLRGRRTIGSFKPEPPPAEVIDKAIELASWAPNHHLTQPWRVYRLGPETTSEMIDLAMDLVAEEKGAEKAAKKRHKWTRIPSWLVVTQALSDKPLTRREDFAAVSCAIQNLQLYLWSCGVGVKWSSGAITRDPRLLDLLWADRDSEEVIGLLQIGYPAKPARSRRKPPAEFTIDLP